MNKKNLTIFIILILILGGVFVYFKKQQNNIVPEAENVSQEIDTSDWETFRDEELGIEFKYPSDWTIKSRPNCVNTSYLTTDQKLIDKYGEDLLASVDICNNELKTTLIDYLRDFGYQDLDLQKPGLVTLQRGIATVDRLYSEVSLSGQQAYIFKSLDEGSSTVYLEKNGKVYVVLLGYYREEFAEDYILRIVETLKFLK